MEVLEKILKSLEANSAVAEIDVSLVKEFVKSYPNYAQKVCEELERPPLGKEPNATEIAYFMGHEGTVEEVDADETVSPENIQTPDLIFCVHRPTSRLLLMSYKRQPVFVHEMGVFLSHA